ETRRLQDPSLKTFIYQIIKDENDEKVVIKLKLKLEDEGEEVNLGFDRDLGFKSGEVQINYTDGGIEVTIIEAFNNGKFRTIENTTIDLPLNRGHLEDARDQSEVTESDDPE
ncbi:MAG TPA: hypothetical protein VIK63_03070, partial [Haloplasmataceae bacterium]